MQSNEVITLADVCEMKDPDDLSKIALSNADELLAESNGSKEMATRVLEIESRLCFSLLNLRLSDPVMYIYNPLDYARQIHQTFVLKWGSRPKRVLFLGMNPGPFGMAQNGVRFLYFLILMQIMNQLCRRVRFLHASSCLIDLISFQETFAPDFCLI